MPWMLNFCQNHAAHISHSIFPSMSTVEKTASMALCADAYDLILCIVINVLMKVVGEI